MFFQPTFEFAKVTLQSVNVLVVPFSQPGVFCQCNEHSLAHPTVSRENALMKKSLDDKYMQNINKSNVTENY